MTSTFNIEIWLLASTIWVFFLKKKFKRKKSRILLIFKVHMNNFDCAYHHSIMLAYSQRNQKIIRREYKIFNVTILCWKERVYSRTSISNESENKILLTTSLLIQLLIKRYLFILFLFLFCGHAQFCDFIYFFWKNNWQGRLSEMYDYRERGFLIFKYDISVKLNQN